PGHAPQFAQGHAFMNQQRNTREAATGKADEPYDNRGSGCGLFFYSKDRGVGKEASQLRTTADARQLHRGTNHSEGQYQQRVAQTDVGQLSAETVGNPNVNRQ